VTKFLPINQGVLLLRMLMNIRNHMQVLIWYTFFLEETPLYQTAKNYYDIINNIKIKENIYNI